MTLKIKCISHPLQKYIRKEFSPKSAIFIFVPLNLSLALYGELNILELT